MRLCHLCLFIMSSVLGAWWEKSSNQSHSQPSQVKSLWMRHFGSKDTCLIDTKRRSQPINWPSWAVNTVDYYDKHCHSRGNQLIIKWCSSKTIPFLFICEHIAHMCVCVCSHTAAARNELISFCVICLFTFWVLAFCIWMYRWNDIGAGEIWKCRTESNLPISLS